MKHSFLVQIIKRVLIDFGSIALLIKEVISSLIFGNIRGNLILAQIVEMGYRSQAVVMITGGFTGAVFTAQTFFQFNALNMSSAVGPVISVSLFRELGPVLSALMVAGRVGASMSAEIGSMQVSQQIDALRALGVHPVDYLVLPRVIAMLIVMPLLVGECIFSGIVASYFIANYVLHINSVYFLYNMWFYTVGKNIVMAMVKAFFFAILIVIIGCNNGLNTSNGAVGVGTATTKTVVVSSLAILISNFFLTILLNIIYPVVR